MIRRLLGLVAVPIVAAVTIFTCAWAQPPGRRAEGPETLVFADDSNADRAIRLLRAGKYDDAIRFFERAIKANPDDAGHDYVDWKKELTEESIEHGEIQVHQMVAHRPAMADYVTRNDPVWRWAVRKFAGEDTGSLIYWDPRPPTDGASAEHSSPYGSRGGTIRIMETRTDRREKWEKKSCEELWADAVFELHNITNADDFLKCQAGAIAGELDKKAFVTRMFHLEWRAAQRTRAFYVRQFLPWAKETGFSSEPYHWYATIWGDPDQVFSRYTDENEYPWNPYGRYFDEMRGKRKRSGADK